MRDVMTAWVGAKKNGQVVVSQTAICPFQESNPSQINWRRGSQQYWLPSFGCLGGNPAAEPMWYLRREGFAAAQQGESTIKMAKHEHEPH